MGGRISDTVSKTDLVEGYDQLTDTWSYITPMNLSRNQTGEFVINRTGYVVAGETNINANNDRTVERLTSIGNNVIWDYAANLAYGGGWQITATETNNNGIVIGGVENPFHSEIYDPIINAWASLSNTNASRRGAASFSINNYAYVFGDRYSTTTTEKYDGISWVYVTPLLTGNNKGKGVTLLNNGYYIGGQISLLQTYDDLLNIWDYRSPFISRYQPKGLSINNEGYSIAGSQPNPPLTSGNTFTTIIEKYNPLNDIWEAKNPCLLGKRDGGSFTINDCSVPLGQINIQEIYAPL